MSKILFSCLHRPDRSPSQRFRFEQYLGILKEKGCEYDYSYVISERDDQNFYAKGKFLQKAFILLKSFFIRLIESFRLSKYDVIYVQREAFMLGTTFFEKRYAKSKATFIFDFDDSIWLQNVSKNNKALSFLKNARKTDELIALADLVVTGNTFLAEYARKFNKNVQVIPTTVDTDRFKPRLKSSSDDVVCIGWSGSHTTIEHLKTLLPVLYQVNEKFGERVRFKVIGDPAFKDEKLDCVGTPWSSEDEVQQLAEIDIGLMPLPNSDWTKGKCGLKGLTYMALEIPTVMSAVGVNTEIIDHETNGFLCYEDQDWFETLSKLVDNKEYRVSVKTNARNTVLEKYSVLSQQDKYLEILWRNR